MPNGPSLTDLVTVTAIPALTVGVSQRGTRTVASGGRYPGTGSSPYRIASLTKTFTSAATVLALSEIARILSALQRPLTGDDLSIPIAAFAA